MKKLICILTMVVFFTNNKFYSQSKSDKYYKKNPVWIEMMDDPKTNYFEAIKAYDLFWKNRPYPREEKDVLDQKKEDGNKEKEIENRKEIKERKKEAANFKKYGLHVKKFEHWKKRVLPFVQPDGRILTEEEKLKAWVERNK